MIVWERGIDVRVILPFACESADLIVLIRFLHVQLAFASGFSFVLRCFLSKDKETWKTEGCILNIVS